MKTGSSEHTLREQISNSGQDKLKRAYVTRANPQQRSRQAQASIPNASKFPTTVKTSSSEHTLRDRFFDSGQKKSFVSFNELLNFFRKHRSPTAICLIEQAADDQINFQTVVKKRGFASFDELLKCCRQFSIFQQQARTGLVSSSYSSAVSNFRFSTKRTNVL